MPESEIQISSEEAKDESIGFWDETLSESWLMENGKTLKIKAAKMTPLSRSEKREAIRQRERNFLIKGQGFNQQERKEFRLKSVSRPENKDFSE